MSNVPAVRSFPDMWKLQPFSSDKETTNLNALNFSIVTVNSSGNSCNAQGRMQTIKVLGSKDGKETNYWWGYAQQVNWKTPSTIDADNTLYQYMVLRD